jgi:DNA-binding CsgD family transcriptional regulator
MTSGGCRSAASATTSEQHQAIELGRPQRRGQDSRPESTPLRRHEDNIYRLWDELADFGSDATNEALMHCMHTICGWIGAQNAFWIGAVRIAAKNEMDSDPASGWRIGRVEPLNAEFVNLERLQTSRQPPHAFDPGDAAPAVISGAGQFRIYSLGTGVADLEAFQKTEHYDRFYRQPGVSDRIWVVFPINVDAESYFVFDTHEEGRRFGKNELYMAAEALRGIKWFHRQQLLAHGLGISDAPLTQAERRILAGLLSGASEKIIAHQLNLTQGTVHQYVTNVYRKFGVRGRAEFMALWLRGGRL